MIKIFTPSNNNTIVSDIKSKIAKELKNRYGFITTPLKEEEPIFAPNKFAFLNNIYNNLFSRGKIASPLIYAKTLVEDSKSHEQRRLESAMDTLKYYANFIKGTENADYDYKINGIPVKWYDKFVQVGSYIIPFYEKPNYFEGIKNKKTKETVFNLLFTISETIEETYNVA